MTRNGCRLRTRQKAIELMDAYKLPDNKIVDIDGNIKKLLQDHQHELESGCTHLKVPGAIIKKRRLVITDVADVKAKNGGLYHRKMGMVADTPHLPHKPEKC